MNDVVTVLTIDARGAEQGSASYIRATRAAQAAVDRLRDAEDKAKAARDMATLRLASQSDSIARTARQWEKLRASMDPIVAATKQIEDAQIKADAAFRRGIATQQEAARVVDQVRQKYAGVLGANDNRGGLAQHELVNLSRQAQDVFVSLSSGQNPLTVLIQQGSQIADVFANAQGSFGGFLRQAATGLARFALPISAVTVALTGLYAAFSVRSERLEVENALLGVGRAAGTTGDQLNQLAKDAADAGGVSVATARNMAAEFTRTGKIVPAVTSDLIRLAKNYAYTTGQELQPAVKELAEAYADPIRGAEQLNQRLGFLDATMLTSIRRSAEMGDRVRAQRLLTDALNSSVVQAEQAQSAWNRAWEKYISLPLARAKEAVGSALLPATEAERIQELEEQLRTARARPGDRGFVRVHSRTEIEGLEQQLQALLKLQGVDQSRAELAGRTAEQNERSLKAQEAFMRANPERRNRDELNRDVNIFEREIAALKEKQALVSQDGGRERDQLSKINTELADYTRQRERAMTVLGDYTNAQRGLTLEQDKARRLDELNATTLQDGTLATRAQIEAKRTMIDLIGTETSSEERRQRAQAASQRVLAEGRQVAADQRRASQEGVDLANAEAEAIQKRGSAAALEAKLRQQVIRDVRGTGEDNPEGRQTRFNELIAEERAKVTAEIARQNAQLREQTTIGQGVLARTAAQGLGEQEIAQRIQQQADLQARLNQMKSVGASDEQIATAQRELLSLKQQELTLQQQIQLAGMTGGQRQQIETLELEILAMGRNNDERARMLATLRAEQELRQRGIPVISQEGQEYVANAQKIAGLTSVRDKLTEIQSLGRDALKGFLSDLRSGAKASDALRNALDRVADKLFDIASNQIMNSLFGSSGGSGGGWLAKFFSSFWSGGSGSGTPTDAGGTAGFWSARGNAFAYGNVIPFARGGAFTDQIVRHPTTFPFARGTGLMGEAGPEAVMPLRRDSQGRLGVAAAGGGAPQFNMQVVNNAGAEVKTEKRENDTGGLDIVMMIDQAVAESVSKPGSATNQALRTNFGARQQLTRR